MKPPRPSPVWLLALAWLALGTLAATAPSAPEPKRVRFADRTGYWLEIGTTTTVPLELHNRESERLADLRVSVETDAPWLEASLAGEAQPVPGVDRVWTLPAVGENDGVARAAVNLTVKSSVAPIPAAPVAGPQGKTAPAPAPAISPPAPTQPMDQGNVTFSVWRVPRITAPMAAAATVGAAAAPAADAPPAPTKVWKVTYLVRTATQAMAAQPLPMEWHFVAAEPGETRPIALKVRNLNPNEPIKNFTVLPSVDKPQVSIVPEKAGVIRSVMEAAGLPLPTNAKPKPAVTNSADVPGIPGLNSVPPKGEGTIQLSIRVGDQAQPGTTATVALDVRTSTIGTQPNPWNPQVLVEVRFSPYELPGNFEACVGYNLPPAPGETVQAGSPGTPWRPLPKGTKVIVSQVYTLPGENNVEKDVEQFIGYGNVLDDSGYVNLRISPVLDHQDRLRLRLVAETIANRIETSHKKKPGGLVVDGYKALAPRCAVTPSGKRVFRNISHTFQVRPTDHPTRVAGGKALQMYVPLPDQRAAWLDDHRILIPYYGHEKDIDPNGVRGIPIRWEGELSTGGVINHFMDQRTPLMQGFETMASGAFSGLTGWNSSMSGGTGADEYNWQLMQHPTLGIVYHNQNELLAVLDALVRAQDLLQDLPFFQTNTLARAADATPLLPPVIAQWRRLRGIAQGETGYLETNGVWRLAVQANPEDPDEADLGLILRGYGAAIRHHFFKTGDPDNPATPTPPSYAYHTRTNPRRAWEEGFDVFFAACVLNSGKVLNQRVGPGGEAARAARSVDLDEILSTTQAIRGDQRYEEKFARVRGADNTVAVAAGLWSMGKGGQAPGVLQWILESEGGSLPSFLSHVCARDAGRLLPLVQLGLCPRVTSTPPAFLYDNRVDPRTVRILWDPNGMLAFGEISGKLLLFGDTSVSTAAAFKSNARTPVEIPMGHLPDLGTGNAVLASTRDIRGSVHWSVETSLGEGLAFQWPLQSYLSRPPTHSLARGGNAPVGSGDLTGPSLPGKAVVASQTVHSVFDGRKVLGGEVHRLGYVLDESEEGVSDFPKPMDLVLAWSPEEDPGQATPGIYFFDPDKGAWELSGTTPAGERRVKATIHRAGAYALMMDTFPPELRDLHAWPNPFPARQTNVTWNLEADLSEPALVRLHILDAKGGAVRKVADKEMAEKGRLAFSWNGKDDRGVPVPDGDYRFALSAWDESGLAAIPQSGPIHVFNGRFASAKGKVSRSLPGLVPPEATLAGFNLIARADPLGEYWLLGIPPGSHTLTLTCPGHFDENLPIAVERAGESVRVPDTQLSHLAMGPVRVSSVLFSPDGDGDRDFVSLRYAWTRSCPYEARVLNGSGTTVRTLRDRQPAFPGAETLVWSGEDDQGMPLASGWYRVTWTAFNGEEAIPQAEQKVLLDRGLVSHAVAMPQLFSPNGDGFEDVLDIGFNLENACSISLDILGTDETALVSVTNAVSLAAGWRHVQWDGRGKDGNPLPDGRYGFRLTPVYEGGFTSKIVRGEFHIDALPPEIGGVEPRNGAVVRTGLPRLSARILSRLDDIDPDQLKFKIDENTVEADEIDLGKGTFAYTPKTSLGPGVHIAIAYAQDWAGNMAPPQAVSFTVDLGGKPGEPYQDRQAPEILSLLPTTNAILYAETPLITARLRDAGEGIDPVNIRLSINGDAQVNEVLRFIPGKSGKAWDWYAYKKALLLFDPLEGVVRYVPLAPLPAGKNVLTLEVLDRAGNRSARRESVFQMVPDRESPSLRWVSPKPGSVLANPPQELVAGVVEVGKSGIDVSSFRCLVNQQPVPPERLAFDPATGRLRVHLAEAWARDAQHVVTLAVRDRAGNVGRAEPSLFTLVADGDAPRVDILLPAEGSAHAPGTPVRLAAAVYDLGRSGFDPAAVEVKLDGHAIPPRDFTTGSPGYVLSKNFLDHQLEALAPGPHVLEIRCRDRAGNASAPSVRAFEVGSP